ASMLCWWVIGIPFSRLWWLVNASQQRWILICYAWEVPAVGWTGAVLLPALAFRRLQRRLEAGDSAVGAGLVRFPLTVALLVIGTSSVGYLLGAIQIDYFTHLPGLEFAKITVQGPVLGGLFAVAAYLMAERAVERLDLPHALHRAEGPVPAQALYGKILSITLAVAVGVAVPVFLHGLTQWQRLREQTRAEAMLHALDEVSSGLELRGPLAAFGPHTQGFVVRRSNNFIVAGDGAGRVLYGDGHHDFQPIQQQSRGWFASRDDEHKVVAFQYRPAALPDGDGAVLVAVSPFSDYGGELIAAAKPAAVVAGGALAIALALAAMLARSIAAPIGRLRAAAVQMADGDLDVAPVALARGDEVAALAAAFDRMATRVRTDEADLRRAYDRLQRAQTELVQHERLSAVGRLVSGVAHELNNPLTAVLHLAEELQLGATMSGSDREALELIANQARRCRSIVLDLLTFASGRERQPEGTELAELVGIVRRGVEPLLGSMGVRLAAVASPGAPRLWVDQHGLEQVLTNLIVNGAQAAGSGGSVRVLASGDAEGWSIVVEDSGAGIPPDVLPRIFEPFFTTREEGKGTGLGLSVSLGIVERQGGTIDADGGAQGSGARFTVRIPRSERTSPPSGIAGASRPATGTAALVAPPHNGKGAPIALVIDDERSVRMALTRYFERGGWDVRQAEGGEEALELLADPAAPAFQLVITDLRMPGRTGMEVHDWLAEHRPDLFERLIIATGDVASPPVRDFLRRTTRPVLEKPFELGALAAMVERVIAGR
ncbi:MAG TPA: ATP-binding protein, partial [Gemmatimonadales bacterium]|nr:ATP-binding protein [Gemmatimonadales bacterium]